MTSWKRTIDDKYEIDITFNLNEDGLVFKLHIPKELYKQANRGIMDQIIANAEQYTDDNIIFPID